MIFKMYLKLDSMDIYNKSIVPVYMIYGTLINNEFLSFEANVVALIVKEDANTYYKNISLSKKNYSKLKNNTLFEGY